METDGTDKWRSLEMCERDGGNIHYRAFISYLVDCSDTCEEIMQPYFSIFNKSDSCIAKNKFTMQSEA